jgi:hypothetical protein
MTLRMTALRMMTLSMTTLEKALEPTEQMTLRIEDATQNDTH